MKETSADPSYWKNCKKFVPLVVPPKVTPHVTPHVTPPPVSVSNPHSILSLDSAKDQGLVTSLVVEYMESRAYFLARGQYCIKERSAERIAVPELFDTVAGSETGALIAANLLLPNTAANSDQINARWATATTNWFKDEINTFYYHYKFPRTAIFFCSLLLAFIAALVGFRVTDRMFVSKEYDEILKHFKEILHYKKKLVKKPDSYDSDEFDKKIDVLQLEIHNKKGAVRSNIDRLLYNL